MSDVLQVVESVIHEQEPPLSTGLYTVRTVPSLQIVGRNIVEEDSNNPKVINGQPLGVPINDNTTFLFRRVGGDTFFISCGRDGGRVVEMEGKVVAVFSDVPEDPFEYFVNPRWIIQRQPQHGDDIYTYVTRYLLDGVNSDILISELNRRTGIGDGLCPLRILNIPP